MKINEIAINNKDLVFETLISNVAATVARLFLDIKYITNNFTDPAQDVLSMDEILDIIYDLKSMLDEANESFDATSQTITIITSLLNYFNTGF